MQSLVGREGALAVPSMIKNADEPGKGLVASANSMVLLVAGATAVFAELQSALDRIWHVPEAEKPSGVWAVLRARVLSFGLILGLVFLLMVSLLVIRWLGRRAAGIENPAAGVEHAHRCRHHDPALRDDL